MLITRVARWVSTESNALPKLMVYTLSRSRDNYPTSTSVDLHARRFGLVRTVLFVLRITQAGTGDVCFVFFNRRIFLGEDLRAAIDFEPRKALFK